MVHGSTMGQYLHVFLTVLLDSLLCFRLLDMMWRPRSAIQTWHVGSLGQPDWWSLLDTTVNCSLSKTTSFQKHPIFSSTKHTFAIAALLHNTVYHAQSSDFLIFSYTHMPLYLYYQVSEGVEQVTVGIRHRVSHK